MAVDQPDPQPVQPQIGGLTEDLGAEGSRVEGESHWSWLPGMIASDPPRPRNSARARRLGQDISRRSGTRAPIQKSHRSPTITRQSAAASPLEPAPESIVAFGMVVAQMHVAGEVVGHGQGSPAGSPSRSESSNRARRGAGPPNVATTAAAAPGASRRERRRPGPRGVSG